MKNIWIMAGESSGDLYGAELGNELRRLAAERGEELTLSGMGGEKMIAAGIKVKVDSSELGVVGIFEVFKNIFTFINIFRFLVKEAAKERPDAVILIDYPGFNLRFAKKLYKMGIKVIWYISPQVWVWGKKRLPVLKKICSEIMVIFPFEVDFYAQHGYNAKFVGHPLLDAADRQSVKFGDIVRDDNEVLLLPGSRKSEITRLLLPMLKSILRLKNQHPQLHYHIAAPREKVAAFCRDKIAAFRRKHPDLPEIGISLGDTAKHLRQAGTGIAASGTVTVEAALAGLPLVVGYKLNYFTLLLASVLVKLYRGFFVMPNIIADKEIYPELLQWHFNPKRIVSELEKRLPGGEKRQEVEQDLAGIRKLLASESGNAAGNAAKICLDTIENQTVSTAN